MFHTTKHGLEENHFADNLELTTQQLEPCELTETIKNSLEICASTIKQKNIQLILELPRNNVWIKIDITKLSQLITYLMSSIIKHTNHGSIIFASNIEPNLGVNSTKPKEIIINFVIKYTDLGMLHANLKYTESQLNLSLSQKIVQLMGGTIQLEQLSEQDTQILFSIKSCYLNGEDLSKCIRIKTLRYKRRPSLPPDEIKGRKILIMETDQIHRAFLLNQLNHAKYICYTASDRTSILTQHAQNIFALILIELKIQNADHIEEIIKEIRKKDILLKCYTPIIGLINLTRLEKHDPTTDLKIKHLTMQCGTNDYLIKSYKANPLFDVVIHNILLNNGERSNVEQEQLYTHTHDPDLGSMFHAPSSITLSSDYDDHNEETMSSKNSHKERQKKFVTFSLYPSISTSSSSLSSQAWEEHTPKSIIKKHQEPEPRKNSILPNLPTLKQAAKINHKKRCIIS